MNAPEKCPMCGARRVSSDAFACGSGPHFNQDGFYESWDCVIRQRDALAARVDLLNRGNETARKMICEAIGMENQACEGDILGAIGALRDRVTDAERERDHANDTANAVLKEASTLRARAKELEEAGDAMRKALDRFDDRGMDNSVLREWDPAEIEGLTVGDLWKAAFAAVRWDKAKEAKP